MIHFSNVLLMAITFTKHTCRNATAHIRIALSSKRPTLDYFVLFAFQFMLMVYHKEVLPRRCSSLSKLSISTAAMHTNLASERKAVKWAAATVVKD